MSIRKKLTKTGEVKWEVREHIDGRGSKRVTRRFDRKSDAEAFLLSLKKSIAGDVPNEFNGGGLKEKTFRVEAEYWLNSASMKFSPGHVKRMEGIFNEVLPVYGDLTLDKITPEFITKFQKLEKEKGLQHSTINRKVQIFTSVLSHSLKHRRINFNPIMGYSKLKESDAEMFYWDRADAESFLDFTNRKYPRGSKDRKVYVAYLAALNTACRAGELWGMKPVDISEDGFKITIRRQYLTLTQEFGPPKGKKSRIVPCNAHLRNEIAELVASSRIGPDETIFLNGNRRPFVHDNFIKRKFIPDIEEWSRETGGKAIRFHDLRHTATTLMIARGFDIKTVKEICGHQDISTTMRYVHMVAGNVENVAKTFSIGSNDSKFTKEVSVEKESRDFLGVPELVD